MQCHASLWCRGFILLLRLVIHRWWWWMLGYWQIKQGGQREWWRWQPGHPTYNENIWFRWFSYAGWPQFVLWGVTGKTWEISPQELAPVCQDFNIDQEELPGGGDHAESGNWVVEDDIHCRKQQCQEHPQYRQGCSQAGDKNVRWLCQEDEQAQW